MNLLATLTLVSIIALSLFLISAIFKDFLDGAREKKLPRIALLLATLVYLAVVIAISLATLFAIFGKLGEPECQHGAFLAPDMRNAFHIPEREIVFKTGVTIERAARVIGVKQHKIDRQALPDHFNLGEFFEFHIENIETAGRNHVPKPFTIQGERLNCFPGGSLAPSADELNRFENANVALGEIHHPKRAASSFWKQAANNHARVPLCRKLFPHDLECLVGGADHIGRLARQVSGEDHHRQLHEQGRNFHEHSLASASELDRILREGLRGREG